MKRLLPTDRPREKLARLGAEALGDNELLALVLGEGTRERDALALANELLVSIGGLERLPRVRADDLRRVPGVGAARAARVVAALQLGRRTLSRRPVPRSRMLRPKDIAAVLVPEFGAREVEHFGLVALDTKHHVLRISVVSVGTLDASLVHPREVFREATAACAAAIILFHNHPSGDPAPSRDDILLTRRLVDAGTLMGIDVLDHLIVADTAWYSLKEQGHLAG